MSPTLSQGHPGGMRYASKADLVAAGLREQIIKGEFAAGAALRQRDIAARFGVSPTPVREALKRLETEGLVEIDPHRGASVVHAEFGPSEDNFQVRSSLESLAARLAASRITEDELAELRVVHEELKNCSDSDSNVNDLNRQFHFMVYEASNSALLLALLRLLWQAFPEGPQVRRPVAESVAQHEQILQALAAGNGDEAARLTADHILGVASTATGSSKEVVTEGGGGGSLNRG